MGRRGHAGFAGLNDQNNREHNHDILSALCRRALLAAGTAALAAPRIARAAAKSIVVADSGGALEAAFDAALYKPFTAKTGIEIVKTVNTYAKLKAMVEANAVEWDVMQLDSTAAANFTRQGLLEKLDYGVINKADLIEGAAHESYLQCDVVAACIAWNTKNVKPAQVPKTWAELWDLKRFSGQRGIWKQPYETMELALMADGVAPGQAVPDRCRQGTEKSRPHQIGDLLVDQRGAVRADPDRRRHRRDHGVERPPV